MELFKTVPEYFIAIYLFVQLLRFRSKKIEKIEKLPRRHLINSFKPPKFWDKLL